MDILTMVLIAIGLAMDSLAVSITSGLEMRELKISKALKIAVFFGSFQALMPVLGWLAGLSLTDLISGIDHWIAFALLSLIGCKMIYESIRLESREKVIDPMNVYLLLMLSIATSIDALAVGITFAFLEVSIVTPIIIIGVVTFLLSLLGVFVGNKVGHLFEKKIGIAGGLILIGIGIRILIEHLA
ncbi:MAG: manganese efflux pump MntP family protein [Candidatus Thermoplasmatota archaeon]|nr:manganese efflux pump MntP family protein [Candidatus Thermoplasmatota archaeon]